MYRKRVYWCICIFLSILFLLSACGEQKKYDEINENIVAAVNGKFIYLEELSAQKNLSGQDDETFYRDLLQNKIEDTVIYARAEAMGYADLSEEELNQIEKTLTQEIDERYRYYYAEMQQNYPNSSEAELETYTQNAVAAYVAESGETEEYLRKTYTQNLIYDKLYDFVTSDATVSEEEIRARYEEYLEQDQRSYTEHPEYFESDKTTNAVYYNLPGYRYIRYIRVSSAEDAQTVLSLSNTTSFDSLIEEYTEDRGSLDYRYGVAVCADSTSYPDGFTSAAMALEKPGDLSEILSLEDGYYILQYAREIPEGPEDYAEMHDYIEEDLRISKISELWIDTIAKWCDEAEIDIFETVLQTLFEPTKTVE